PGLTWMHAIQRSPRTQLAIGIVCTYLRTAGGHLLRTLEDPSRRRVRSAPPAPKGGAPMHRARSRFSPVAVALLIPALSTCAAGDAGAPDWAGTRDTVDGVEIVRNPAAPLLDDDAVV